MRSIVRNWIVEVCLDKQISIANDLSHLAIQNHLPDVLRAMATVLSQSQDSDIEPIVQSGLEHGVLMAEQGFTPGKMGVGSTFTVILPREAKIT